MVEYPWVLSHVGFFAPSEEMESPNRRGRIRFTNNTGELDHETNVFVDGCRLLPRIHLMANLH